MIQIWTWRSKPNRYCCICSWFYFAISRHNSQLIWPPAAPLPLTTSAGCLVGKNKVLHFTSCLFLFSQEHFGRCLAARLFEALTSRNAVERRKVDGGERGFEAYGWVNRERAKHQCLLTAHFIIVPLNNRPCSECRSRERRRYTKKWKWKLPANAETIIRRLASQCGTLSGCDFRDFKPPRFGLPPPLHPRLFTPNVWC